MQLLGPGEAALSYRSAVDSTDQPFRVYVPARPRRRYPLVVLLHGFGGRMAPFGPEACRWADWLGLALLSPDGRGNQHWDGLGEDDVLSCLAAVHLLLPLDPARCYLHGWSMGGHGALRLGLRFPHLFAACSAVAGWVSGEQWYARWYAAPGEWQPPHAVAHLVAAASPAAWRENAAAIRGRLAFGTADDVNEPEDTEWLLAHLAQAGLRGRGGWQAERVRGGGHGAGGAWGRVLPWLARQRRRWPRRFVSPTLRHADLGWVRAEWRPDPLRPVQFDLDWAPGRATIAVTNAGAVTVTPHLGPPELRQGAVDVTINQCERVRLAPGESQRVELFAAPPGPYLKQRGLDGPVGEVLRGPFAVVAPVGQRAAAQRFCAAWDAWLVCRGEERTGPAPVVQCDVPDDVTPVVWAGTPWLQRWQDWPEELAVRPLPDGIAVCGERFAGAHIGYLAVHPIPWQPTRLALLCRGWQDSAIDPEARPQAVGKDLESLPWRYPDVVVWDSRRPLRESVQPSLRVLSDSWLLAGTLDAGWRSLCC